MSHAEVAALVAQHEGFVRQRVKRRVMLMPHLRMHEDDLLQEGRVAIVMAAQRFDATRGVRFLSYAAHWVDHGLLNFANRKAQLIRFWDGAVPSYVSLDAPMDDDDERMMHGALRAPEAEVMHSKDEAEVMLMRRAMMKLPKRQQVLLWRRHAEGKCYRVIGEEMGLTRERVRQIENVAMTRLRKVLALAHRGTVYGRNGDNGDMVSSSPLLQVSLSSVQAQARKPMLRDGEGVAA